MALDPRFICSSDLEGVFLDKLTGFPLAAGILNFYADGSSVPKTVYQTTGSPPTGFVPLGTSITLNSIGGYQDGSGNSIVIYYFPFHCTTDGDPSTSTGVLELYSVHVFSSGLIPQFTREAWPPLAVNLAPVVNNNNGVTNYIPNGQFLFYNAHPITEVVAPNDVKRIAQGGWSFKQTTGSTGVYVISFNTEINSSSGLKDFPFNSVNIVCSSFGNETIHDLVVEFPGVNTFATLLATNQVNSFNILFASKVTSGTQPFEVNLISNFGTGGSTEITTTLTTVTVTSTYTYFNVTISAADLPNNSSATIGDGNYIAIAIRTPPNAFSARFTDFALTLGTDPLSSFPIMTEADMLTRGIAGWMPTPAHDGSDLYLPLVLTDKGMTFDHSIVGQIVGKTQTIAVNNELLMDGSTYISSNYSSIGIPYSRLANYLIANSPAITIGTSTIPAGIIPLFGTGANFVTVLKNTDPTKFDLSFNTTSGGNATNNQTSGFTHTSADPLYVYTVTGVPAVSTYFSFTVGTGGLVFNVWFSVDGSGTAPATPTGANIEVPLVTGDTVAITITKIVTAVNQYQFLIIDARGYFWRGLDTGTSVDPDSATRTIPGIKDNGVAAVGAYVGSLEAQAFLDHTHDPFTGFINFGGSQAAGASTPPGAGAGYGGAATTGTSSTGGLETRPVNLALNWYIKY